LCLTLHHVHYSATHMKNNIGRLHSVLKHEDRLQNLFKKLSQEETAFICEELLKDPFGKLYLKAILIYTTVLLFVLLFPFDFHLLATNHAEWNNLQTGINFPERGQILSEKPAKQLAEKIIMGTGLSIEIWVETLNSHQDGPARIISFSSNTASRNFTLGQSFDQLIFRLRTTETSNNGTNPHLVLDHVFMKKELLHIVVTYNKIEQQVFINGELKGKFDHVKGNFNNWDVTQQLVIGNEVTGNRPWMGKIYFTAIYNSALNRNSVFNNYLLGPDPREVNKVALGVGTKPVAVYLFDENGGNVVLDSAAGDDPLNLSIPVYIKKKPKLLLTFPDNSLLSSRNIDHFIMNVMIFIPFGFFLFAAFIKRFRATVWTSLIAISLSALFILTVESLQFLSLTRDSSLFDVFANLVGAINGVALYSFANTHLKNNRKRIGI